MKTTNQPAFKMRICAALLLSIIPAAAAQQTTNTVNDSSTIYSIVSRTQNSRLWLRTTPWFTNQSGQVIAHTNSYSEVASGLCWRRPDGQFTDTVEQIEIVSDGAAASNA